MQEVALENRCAEFYFISVWVAFFLFALSLRFFDSEFVGEIIVCPASAKLAENPFFLSSLTSQDLLLLFL